MQDGFLSFYSVTLDYCPCSFSKLSLLFEFFLDIICVEWEKNWEIICDLILAKGLNKALII